MGMIEVFDDFSHVYGYFPKNEVCMTTDTTKQIDLSTLERSDEVVMGDGLKCFVTKCKEFQELFAVSLDPIDNDKCRFSSDLYFKNGISKTAGDLACNNIIEIIKNPKRWSDDDMKTAFEAGMNFVLDK